MRKAAATGRGATRTAALVISVAVLASWVGAAGAPSTPAQPVSSGGPAPGSLSLGAQAPGALDFVPEPRATPTAGRPAQPSPRGGPFLLIAALPSPGTYILSVAMVADIVDAVTGDRITAADIRYETQPVGPSAPEGCSPAGWRPVGGGSRVAVLHGPGVCRLRIRVRWSWGAGAAPGHYHGALRWVLSSAAP